MDTTIHFPGVTPILPDPFTMQSGGGVQDYYQSKYAQPIPNYGQNPFSVQEEDEADSPNNDWKHRGYNDPLSKSYFRY